MKKDFKTLLNNRERIIGTSILSDSPMWFDEMKKLELDFAFFDTEHTPLERKSLAWMCKCYKEGGMYPVIRVRKADSGLINNFLDLGAMGIMIPYAEDLQDVKMVIGAVKYNPIKGVKLKNILEGGEIDEITKEYIKERNKNKTVWINIESKEGVKKLPEMLKTNLVDVVAIGPHDLSVSLGCPEDYHNKIFRDKVDDIIEICKKYNVSCGCQYAQDKESHIEWYKKGMNILFYSADIYGLREYLKEAVDIFKKDCEN